MTIILGKYINRNRDEIGKVAGYCSLHFLIKEKVKNGRYFFKRLKIIVNVLNYCRRQQMNAIELRQCNHGRNRVLEMP